MPVICTKMWISRDLIRRVISVVRLASESSLQGRNALPRGRVKTQDKMRFLQSLRLSAFDIEKYDSSSPETTDY